MTHCCPLFKAFWRRWERHRVRKDPNSLSSSFFFVVDHSIRLKSIYRKLASELGPFCVNMANISAKSLAEHSGLSPSHSTVLARCGYEAILSLEAIETFLKCKLLSVEQMLYRLLTKAVDRKAVCLNQAQPLIFTNLILFRILNCVIKLPPASMSDWMR